MIGALLFDPDPIAFQIPFIQLDIAWYGIFFTLGTLCIYFFAHQYIKIQALLKLQKIDQDIPENVEEEFQKKAYFVDRLFFRLLPRKIRKKIQQRYLLDKDHRALHFSKILTDRIFFWAIVGGILGARLAHVFFYDWAYYSQHLSEIINTRAGGLASHGGAIGAIVGISLLSWFKRDKNEGFGLLDMLDFAAIGMGIGAFFIRMGNFINQEILGTPSSLPWAVTFGHPADGQLFVPRHPVQIYEGLMYLGIFFLLFTLSFRQPKAKKGLFFGLFIVLVFSFRFFIEFFKEEQAMNMVSSVNMGSYLSLPLIGLGLLFIFKKAPVVLEKSK